MSSRNVRAGRGGPGRALVTRLLCGASLTAVALLTAPSAYAQQDRNWDPNGTAAGTGGAGTWNTSANQWSPNADGVSGPYTPWNNGGVDNAIFGGPNGTNATVTLAAPITAHNLTFNPNTTYTLTGGTLTLGGVAPTITANGNATINSILAGAAGLTKAGAGILTLTGANTFGGGVNVTGGTLSVSGDSSLGAASNGINLSSGSVLRSTGALAASRVVTLLSGSAGIGEGVGSARITGAGGLALAGATTLTNNANDFTGSVYAVGYNLTFTSIGNLGEASSLGAPTTAADGLINIGSGGNGLPGGGGSGIYIGDGDTSNRNWNMRVSGVGANLINQGTGTLTLTGSINQNGPTGAAIGFVAQTADLALLGNISGGRPITFSGGGTARTITLGGSNDFTAPLNINSVTVRAATLANAGANSSLGAGAGAVGLTNAVLSYIGAGSSTNRGLLVNGANSVLNDGTGALTLSGAVTFAAAAPADTLTLGGGFAGANTLSGVISGAGNLVMNGAAGSTWLLGGANTYVGSTTVNSGTLQAGGSQAFGAPNAIVVNGGVLDFNNNDIAVTSLAGAGGVVALNGGDLTVNGAASTTYAGAITDGVITGGGLVKRGTSTLTLSGQNTYTGDTTVNGGGLTLNFAAAGAPASNILSGATTLNLAGGVLTLTGAGVANSQSFDGLNVTAGNNRIILTSGAGGGMTLNLGALTRTGGLLDFTLPAIGAITTTNGDGALGWATINGTDYAQVSGGLISAFTAYANKDDASAWLTGDVVADTGGAANTPYINAVNGNVQLGGLKYTAAANSTVTVGAANTLGVDGTIIVAASVGNASQTITGGSITGGAGGGTFGVLHNGTGTGSFTIASTIVDNGGATGFVKGGAGRVALTGANSYTGGTTLSGGTLAINSVANAGAASSIGASTADSANLMFESGTLEYTGIGASTTDRGFTLVNGGPSRTIQVTNGGGNLTFGGVVVGSNDAGLIKTGSGVLTLANAANTYTGVTTVSAGTLSVNTLANGGLASGVGASTADSANLVLQSTGGLQYTGATAGTDRGFTLGTGGGRIGVTDAAAVLTVSGLATGAGGLTKEGVGTLVLSGPNTYSGGTTISAGTLRAGSAQAFGAPTALMSVATGATLDLGGFSTQVGALAGGGHVVLGSATLTSGGTNGTFTGTISGAGAFVRSGAGTQTITGCNNSYTGATSIVGSNLAVDCLANGGLASGIGASSSASANLILNNASLIYTGGSTSTDRGMGVFTTGAISVSNAATTLSISGQVVGSGALRKDGAGTLVLSGNNTYTGITTVTGGVLRAGSINAIGRGGFGLNDTAGVALDLNGFATTIAYLNGGGATGGNVTLGAATLTIASVSGGGSYAGAISGVGGLVKGGTITQALLGCASSYTGSTVINGGVLQVSCLTDGGANSAIGASSNAASNLVLNGGALSYVGAGGGTNRLFTLGASAGSRLDSSGAGAIAFTNTGAIAFSAPGTSQTLALGGSNTGANSFAAQITNNGAGVTSLTKDGAGTWILNNPNSSYTGVTTVNGGVLGVDKLSNGGVASSIGASSAAASNLVIGNGSTLRYTGAGDTTNRLFTLSAGTTFIESSGSGAVVFTDTGPVTLAGANQARTIALGGTNTGNNTLAGSIGDAGTGVTVLAKNDAGTWLLTGNNTYTGVTNINAGALTLGNGGTTGSIASATVNNLGVLNFNRSDTLTFGGAIGGTGTVNQIGAGSTVLTGTSAYTGATTVSAGDLTLQSGGKITATSSLTVSNGGEMIVDGAGSQLVATGPATSVVGDTNVGDSALTVRNGGSASFNALNFATAVNSNATLNVIGAGSQLNAGVTGLGTIGTATVNILGGAKMTSSGASTLFGGELPTNAQALVTVSGAGSEWTVAGALNARRGSLTIANGGVVSANTAVIGATLAGVNNPAATAIVTGAGSRLETTGGLAITNGGGTGALTIADGGVVNVGSGVLAMGGVGQATLNIGAANGAAAVAGGTLNAASITTSAASTITFNHTDPGLVFAAAISGAGHVDQLSGVTILTGNSSHTGGTVISGGVLQLGAGGATGMIAGNITDNGVLAFNRSDTITFGGVISGAGSVRQMGPGVLALTAANTYAGGTVISGGGTLQISSDGNLGDAAGGVTFNNGMLRVIAPIVTSRDITLAGAGTLDVSTTFNAGTSLTLAGDITGPGTLTKIGLGALIITGDATHTGLTTVQQGGLSIGNGGTTGSIAGDIAVNTTVTFNRSDSYAYGGSITGAGTVSVNAGILALTGDSSFGGNITAQPGAELRINAGNTVTSGAIASTNGGVLTVSGVGSTLVAQRLQASTNAGAATINVENGGTIRTTVAGLAMSPTGVAGPSTLNISGAGSLVDLASGLTAAASANTAATSNITISNGGALRSTGSNVIGSPNGNTTDPRVTITGAGSNWTSTGTLTLRDGAFSVLDGGGANFASASFGTTAAGLVNVLLSGANSTFVTSGNLVAGDTGGTGVITLADASRLTVGGAFTLANAAGSTGVLNIGGAEGQAADEAGFLVAPALAFGAGVGRLNFNHTETNYGFATAISGAGAINQVAGVTNLTGDSSAFAGTTTVSGGVLRVNGVLGDASSIVNVLNGGVLGGGGTIGGNVSIAAGGVLAPGASPGTLTIGGDLALVAGSILNFEFGQAGVVGGPLNDLVNVGGDLVLDGTLNVTESAGGTFGAGIYRVFNYGGVLTDNGLDLGLMPAGSTVRVQTSVAGQINLVNTAGLAFSFWDGAAGPKFDNVINGGDGTWHLAGADGNWTDAGGAINDAWSDGTMAIFAGTAGVVTVDNSLGAVTTSGMQFATNGYRIAGAPLTLIGPQSAIQVGDGSAAGAGYVATIDAVLAGATQLAKTDLGTLVLTGANTYNGGTAINGGVLQISSNLNLGALAGGVSFNGGALRVTSSFTSNRSLTLLGAGAIDVGAALFFTETGAVSGVGSLTKTGAGTLILTSDATYTGGTTIAGGTLQLGANGATGSIVGDIVNNGALVFSRTANYNFDGVISGSGSLTQNQGVLSLTADSSYGGGTGINFSELRITAGNTVSSGALGLSQGRLLVSGVGSTFVSTSAIAQSGTVVATIDVQNGGVFRTTSGGLVLRKTSPAGASAANLNVSGAGSLVDLFGALEVAPNAATSIANVTVSDGGVLRSGGSNLIGAAAGNTTAPAVTVTGAGSNWTSTGTLAMTNGALSLLNGGAASFTAATIGTVSAARPASVLVSGADSTFTAAGNVVVGGGAGTGVLTLANGGRVNVGGSFVLADNAAATGVLNIGGAEGAAAAGTGVFNAASLNLGSATSRINFNHTDPAYVFATVLSGSGSVNQTAGVTILTGASSYAGATNVNGGVLLINGDQSAATGLTSAIAGVLGGVGVIGGDVFVANGATLAPGDATGPGALNINGDLGLSGGSTLAYDFGRSNVVGGPLNDLTRVGGDLTLDGAIDVTVSPGGRFDVGLYRVISYGGALNDQGLALGAMPAGSVVGVQTAVAGQVNLVNSAGATVNFWDGGAPANELDGAVNGGDGVWQASGGNNNWADISGVFNNAYQDGAFAIFAAAPGVVTIDNSLGAVTAAGLQFASDGYVITGGGLALTPDAVIRVGDGTADGANYVATIASALAAAGDLAKTDLGTLVLTGAGSVAGDTYVAAGELRLAGGGTLSTVGAYIGRDAGSHGTVTVTGRDGGGNASTWTIGGDFWIGSDGFGTLNIADGGRVISNTGWIGVNSGGGEALVTGQGSSWDVAGGLEVGLLGTGSLRIANGATVSSGNATVGASSRGDAVVTGAGSSWTNAGLLTVGSFAAGTLRIDGGASVASSQGYVGANGDGGVVVAGVGSTWSVTSSTITVGHNANGSLTIEDGARVRAEGGIRLGTTAGVNATLMLRGTAANLAVLETSGLQADLGNVSLTLDGGLLRATQDAERFFIDFDTRGIDVTLGANGGVIDTDGHDIGIAPRFVGAGGLTKDGAGTLTLTGANTYAGATLVNAGALLINGDQTTATGLTTVLAGATLGGGGIIGGSVDMTAGGTLAAGSNGVGTLTINGDLTLGSGSILSYEFGAAGVVGGTLNDLVEIGGDLTLDGVINVTEPAGGNFGPGIYRVFNYGGVLTDNGLVLGGMPAGSAVSVQTAIAGQVNLVNTAGLTLSFWDGDAGPKNNGLIDGGDGVWRIGGGQNNWTGPDGAINADYAQDSFAIFAGAPGTVTIDNASGAVEASGLQFASSGYVITGGALTLTGADAIVQVGDGSAASAGYVATISADLTGGAGLVKTDAGTLVLTGANSYAGGTAVNGGVLRIASDANLGDAAGGLSLDGSTLHTTAAMNSSRAISLVGTGTFVTDAATALNLDGVISGAGALIKQGGGVLTLTADNSYGGGTVIASGSLQIGNGGTTGSVVGDIVDNGELILARSDSYAIAGRISGTGAVRKLGGTAILTADNSYTGGTTNASGVLQLGDGGVAGGIVGDIINAGTLRFNRSNQYVFSGVISDSGGVEQAGSGTTILTGRNSYAGATAVTAGTLLVNGDQSAATGLTSVASGATLGGVGVIGGDVTVADGGVLTPGAGGAGALTINGGLSLAAGSQLNFDFGAANAVGSPLNDVVNIGGNLTLDGTINIAVTAGGSFDIGLYRIANYGGALTDNGLAVGVTPAGAEVSVQTSVANQVNLINTGGATLNFWDGAAGPKFNGAVNGGDGVWQNSTGNNNWADTTGAVNAGYDDGAFAIFTGAAGVVTVDNSLGAVTASGLQFATGGYTIAGDRLTLAGPQSVIRVGDGTAAGAGYVATIAAELSGAAQLVKTDLGVLVLTGTNSYGGGTAINGGVIRIASDANLGAAAGGLSLDGGTLHTTADMASARAVTLAGTGTFLTDAGSTLTLGGAVAGAGGLTKSGAGTLVLAGVGGHVGPTHVGAGLLLVNGDYTGAAGATMVGSGASLGGVGTIGGDVTLADGATLTPGAGGAGTLTIGGDLSLAGGATLAYEFGAAGVAGGALNDLVIVRGDLVLDGVINVSTSAGGGFGPGLYRVFNYGGALTNNGLTVGALPGGGGAVVQTAISGQVNLVNATGVALSFWDGAAGPKFDGVVNGGSGVWQGGGGNDNWTGADGLINAVYADGTFAVFGGAGGAVTVDDSLGDVTASGMQFAANGYTIAGDAITLTDPQSTIRVGDGSTGGVGFTATITAALSGDAQLVKTDAGTLVLGGVNTYTGGTAINGGTVRIAADSNLGAAAGGVTLDGGALATSADVASARAFVMAGAGAISTADATTFTLSGRFTGAGALTKAGGGTLLLTGDSGGFTGSSTVAAGTLAVTGVLGGAVNIAGGARLEGTGRVGAVANAGTVAPGRDGFGVLTVAGYTGSGGRLEIETALGGDGSQTDRLAVTGATAGATTIDVTNRGGLGGQTVQGIKIVDVTGASNGTFTLNGDYLFQGDQAVIAGAYGYRLYKGGVATPTDGDWYLRSALLNPAEPNEPQAPLYQPGVPIYEAYGQTLLTLTEVGTLQQRVGGRQWAQTESGRPSGIWARMQSSRSRPNAVVSTSLSDVDTDSWKLEFGADRVLSERNEGALVLGVLGGYGEASAGVGSIYGNGDVKTKGVSAGATLTWYGSQGFYVDGRAQFTWFDSRLRSTVLGTLADGNDGVGQAYSVEVGKRVPIGRTLSVTPQVQAVYQAAEFDAFTDPNGAAVSSDQGDSLKTRWSVSVDRQDADSYLYGIASLSYEWLDGTVADVSGAPIARRNHRLWGELGMGGGVRIGERLTLYTEATAETALKDFGESYSLKGTVGLRLSF